MSHLLALAEDLLNDVSIPEDGKSEVVTNHIEQKTKRPHRDPQGSRGLLTSTGKSALCLVSVSVLSR